MSAETIIKAAMANVPKAVACGIVDLKSGMLLGVKTIESHPQSVLDLVAAATRDLFEGDTVLTIENTFKRHRGVTTNEHYFQEILVASTNLWHYFGRLKSNPKVVVTIVTRADANVGLVLMKAREIVQADSL